MSTSDRVCPTHGDVGALPSHNNCPACGAGLVMKSTLRTAGESVVHAAAVGFGLGLGLEAAHGAADAIKGAGENVAEGAGDALGGIGDILSL